MQVRDRQKLATLMCIQEITHREMSEAAGWSSHTFIGRILRGEVTSLKPEPAVRIAKRLGVPVEDLFLTRMDTNPVQNGRQKRTKKPAAPTGVSRYEKTTRRKKADTTA